MHGLVGHSLKPDPTPGKKWKNTILLYMINLIICIDLIINLLQRVIGWYSEFHQGVTLFYA